MVIDRASAICPDQLNLQEAAPNLEPGGKILYTPPSLTFRVSPATSMLSKLWQRIKQ